MTGAPRAAVAVALALVTLDLARSYAPWLVTIQAGVAIVALALLARRLLRDQPGRSDALYPLALAALLVPVYLDHSRNVESDGIHYYAHLRSLLFDGDLDHANDYALLGWTAQGPNVLPIGASLAWIPLVVPVHLLRQAARVLGWGAPTGVEPVYQAAACAATFAYVAAGLFLLLATLRRFASPAVAFWATVLAWVGSPLRFYLQVMPGFAHGVEFFASVLVLRTYLALREEASVRRAALAGAACGFVFLARSQDGLLLALPGLELALRLARGPDRATAVRALVALVVAFLVVASPQFLVWQVQFGRPLVVPHQALHGDDFLHAPRFADVLLSPRGGLFANYPAMLLAALGLLPLLFRDPRYVLTLVPVLVAAWAVNASVFDWYQVRRFTGIVPLLAPALAVVLAPILRGTFLAGALVAFAALRYDLAVDRFRAVPGDPAPVRAVVAEVADGLAADVYEGAERIAPRMAADALATYTGEAFLGPETTRIELPSTSLLRLPRPARHLSEVAGEEGEAVRWVTDRDARLFIPSTWDGEVIVTLRARALETAEPQGIEVSWNEVSLGRQPMAAAWVEYTFRAPASAVRLGTNTLAMAFERAPIYRKTRGTGPRQVRPAAIAWIALERGEAERAPAP